MNKSILFYSNLLGHDFEVDLWEMYEIHSILNRRIQYLGRWVENEGFHFLESRKWIRRHDLEVKNVSISFRQQNDFLFLFKGARFKIQSLPAWPNIKKMTLIPGTDEYEFSGETPDIWFELQVSKYQMISAY